MEYIFSKRKTIHLKFSILFFNCHTTLIKTHESLDAESRLKELTVSNKGLVFISIIQLPSLYPNCV